MKRKLIVHVVFYLGLFVLLPLFGISVNSVEFALTFPLTILNPIACFVASILLGLRTGICWLYPLLPMGMFLPTFFLVYETSAWIFFPIYGGAALLGMAISALFCYIKSKKMDSV